MSSKTKKMISGILSATLMISISPTVSYGWQTENDTMGYTEEITEEPAWIEVDGIEGGRIKFDKETGTIMGAEDSITIANIPSYINGTAVTTIADQAFCYCENLTQVTIPVGVTTIGGDAFSNCIRLTTLELPDGLTTIGEEAFWNCHSLTKIDIPSSVTEIGYSAFRHCDSLVSLVLPDGITNIEWATFTNCLDLVAITIPASVTSIEHHAFWFCDSLTDIYFGGTKEQWDAIEIIEKWGKEGFSNPSTDEDYWDKLSSIEQAIPDDVTIHYGSTTSPDIAAPLNKRWITVDGIEGGQIRFDYATGTIIDAEDDVKIAHIPRVINDVEVKAIGNYVFNRRLTEVTIPDSVTSIGAKAFSYCSSLTEVTIPASVGDISINPVVNCKNLVAINVATDNEHYTDIDGVLFNKDVTQTISYPSKKNTST